MIHCNSGGAIVTVVGADRGKAVLRSVCEVFVFYTYIGSSALTQSMKGYRTMLRSTERTHIHRYPHSL